VQPYPRAGVGAEILAMVVEDSFDHLDAAPERITGVDIPMPYAVGLYKLNQVYVFFLTFIGQLRASTRQSFAGVGNVKAIPRTSCLRIA
jgi:hypothetical protein